MPKDFSPQNSTETLGALRPWGSMSAIRWGSDINNFVEGIDAVNLLKAMMGKIRYQHRQATADTTWTINHNLGNNEPIIIVFDENKVEIPIVQKNYNTASMDSITIDFGVATSGYATVYSLPLV